MEAVMRLVRVEVEEGGTNAIHKAQEHLQDVLMHLGGTYSGTWKANCETYRAASSSKAVFVITTSNGSGTRAVVEWDSRKVLMARGPIMEILKAAGQKKTRGSVTLIGNEYDVGEFVIRVGKAINEHEGKLYGVYLGIACEGVSQTDVASSVILEYLKHLERSLECKSIHLTVLPDVDSEFALGSMYTNKHEAVQIFQLSCTFLQTDDKKIRTGNDAASVPTSIT